MSLNGINSTQQLFFSLPEAAHLFLEFECSLSVFEQEWVDIEYGGEIEGIVDLLGSEGGLIV